MHRKKLLNLLKNHVGSDENEEKMRSQIIEFVKENKNCFERELLIGHITGSALIIDKNHEFTLLTHHRKLNKWLQPGGHCDGESDVLKVAIKEAIEETGIADIQAISTEIFDVDIHEIPERKGIPKHLHYDIRFLLVADKAIPLIISEESNDLAWVKLDEIENFTKEESVLRMISKVKKRNI